jgi:YHS domain-containing protein
MIPASHHTSVMSGRFEMGWTLALNIIAAIALVTLWLLARAGKPGALSATDPICAMTVDTSAPAAMRRRDGVDYYFCSLRCAERFDRHSGPEEMHEDEGGDRVDPVCSMRVDSHSAPSAIGPDGITYYFCSDGCRTTFLAGPNPAPTKIELGRKSSHE